VTTVDGKVAAAEGKLDGLGPKNAILLQRLDSKLSTRATQTSFDSLRGSINTAGDDVATLDSKHNVLAPKNALLLQRLDDKLSTRAMQTSVNALRDSLHQLDTETAEVDSKLVHLHADVQRMATNENNGQTALTSFEALTKRLSIEENLLNTSNHIISIFQLPAAYGGHLTLVRSVVDQTIKSMLAAGQRVNNAERDLARGDARVAVGDFAGAFNEFRSAYSQAVKP
jgi:hypothetical protein